jgi:hypothetical protein
VGSISGLADAGRLVDAAAGRTEYPGSRTVMPK